MAETPPDVPDGLVPGSDEAWAALEERSRALGWTGLQWHGAREYLGYAHVLAEIVALEEVDAMLSRLAGILEKEGR